MNPEELQRLREEARVLKELKKADKVVRDRWKGKPEWTGMWYRDEHGHLCNRYENQEQKKK